MCGEDGGADAVEEGAAVGEVLDRAGEVGVEDGVACAAGPGPLRVEVGLEARVWNRPWRSLGHSRQRLTSFFFFQSWSRDLSCGAVREWSEQSSAPDKNPWKKIAVAEYKEPQLERLRTALFSEADRYLDERIRRRLPCRTAPRGRVDHVALIQEVGRPSLAAARRVEPVLINRQSAVIN